MMYLRPVLTDAFGRGHNYLRISLTEHCNLRCFYCMPEEGVEGKGRLTWMKPEEIFTLARVFTDLGVDKIRLTGGEPLVRKEFGEIFEKLTALPARLLMTTNGLLLHHFVPQLEAAGMRSINISLDTLNENTFELITRRGGFNIVLENIQLLLQRGWHVKVNVVVMKGVNHGELEQFVEWTRNSPVHVRFIEFMPFHGNRWHADKVLPRDEIISQISKRFDILQLGREPQGTAHKYFVKGAAGTFAVISTMSHPFCGDCNRLRLTADGKLRNCLFSENETDLLTPLRNGEDIIPLIMKTVNEKKEKLGGQFDENFSQLHADELKNRSMIRIGG